MKITKKGNKILGKDDFQVGDEIILGNGNIYTCTAFSETKAFFELEKMVYALYCPDVAYVCNDFLDLEHNEYSFLETEEDYLPIMKVTRKGSIIHYDERAKQMY